MKLWNHEIERNAQKLLDKFWIEFTPLWFKWVGWTTALAGLGYLCNKIHSKALLIVYGISWISFYMYFQVFIGKIVIPNASDKKRTSAIQILSLVLAIIVLVFTTLLINHTLKALKMAKI